MKNWSIFGLSILTLVFAFYFLFTYPFGYQEAIVDVYGEKQKIYYKFYYEESEIDFGGFRTIKRVYYLKDEATKWSRFYIYAKIEIYKDGNNKLVHPVNFYEVTPGSFLQEIVVGNSFYSGLLIFEDIIQQLEIKRNLGRSGS